MRTIFQLLSLPGWLVFGLAQPAHAQRPDSVVTAISYTGQLTGLYASGGVNRALLATTHVATLTRGQHFGLPLSAGFTYGKQDRLLKERELTASSTPYYKLRRFRAYGIGGYEHSNLRGIANRVQLGFGPGWVFYSDSLGREVSLSNLLIRESTRFQDDSRRLVSRSSLRLKAAYTQGLLTLSTITFYQPSLQGLGDYRINHISSLGLRITRKMAVNATYAYTHESRVLEGKSPDNTNVTVGFSYATAK